MSEDLYAECDESDINSHLHIEEKLIWLYVLNTQYSPMNRISIFDIQKPTRLNAHYQGNRYETYRLRITGNAVSVDEANAYIEQNLRPHLANTNYLYQIAYLLGDGTTWVHSQFDDQYLLPNFSNHDLVEDDQDVTYIKVNRVLRPQP